MCCWGTPLTALRCLHFFFFNDPATTEIYPLPLHDALPIYSPPYSAYLFDENELWYIPYHRKAHKLPVFVYSGALKDLTLYDDFRTLPVWPLTGDDWKQRLGSYVQSLFNDLLRGHPSLEAALKRMQSSSKLFVFGGFVRDSIHAFVHRQQLEPRDVDLVVDGVSDMASDGVENHFGGIRWQTDGGLRVDCWDLASTLA